MTTFNYMIQRTDRTSGADSFMAFDGSGGIVWSDQQSGGYAFNYDDSNVVSVHVWKTFTTLASHLVWGNYNYSIVQI